MNYRDIGFHRLSNQHIAGEKFEKPEEVVKWMGALQAQDYGQSVWAIGLRTRSGTLADVERAIEDGTIIRTWPMRGTIHFVPPEDARWMLKLSAARMLAADGRRMAQLELTVDILVRCQDLFYHALSGGKRLSRPDLMTLLEDAGISTQHQRGYHILWYCAQNGVICLGPMQGKQQTFELLDEWSPGSRDLPREEALAELARRYFSSHGPATVHDFAWWAGLTVTDARLGLEAATTRADFGSDRGQAVLDERGRSPDLPARMSLVSICCPALTNTCWVIKSAAQCSAQTTRRKSSQGTTAFSCR